MHYNSRLTPIPSRPRLDRYQPDQRGILGLDVYYQTAGGADVVGESLSNVYWTEQNTPETVGKHIVLTEQLDTVFSSIKSISPDTQWIYMTTTDGMMRLYPWASNDHYPDNWDPREIVFYTVAEPSNNPQLQPQWTAPYVDFAGAGWMVTASMPMVAEDGEFLGIMSHDVTINSLKEIALSINVLDGAGYGFLIDPEAKVIAHPDFLDEDASKGTQEETSLLSLGSAEYRNLIGQMVAGMSGLGYYGNDNGDSLLVYAPIPETGWSLGISVPREEVIAPAIDMRNRAVAVTVVLVVIAVALAVLLSHFIHRPVVQLLQGVQQVAEDNQQADEISVNSFDEFEHLAIAFNKMASKVWERERNLKQKVADLRIEIDQNKKKKRLDSIVETDFFKRLELNVNQLRADVRTVPSSAD